MTRDPIEEESIILIPRAAVNLTGTIISYYSRFV